MAHRLHGHVEWVERSNIPRVIGLLAIVFASFGLLVTLATPWSLSEDLRGYELETAALGKFWTWTIASTALSVALFAVHLTGGILAVRYSPSAPFVLTVYGVMALVLLIADTAMAFATFPSGLPEALREETVGEAIATALGNAAWPIVVLALMNQHGARAACARHETAVP